MINELKISEVLKELGVPANLVGYFYLKCAIELMVDDFSFVTQITKKLYPAIARKFNVQTHCVERAIRHAIEVGWSRGNMELQSKIFGYTIDAEKGKPTNTEFMSAVADWLKMTACESGDSK